MNIQCRRSSAWESTRPNIPWGEAEDRAVVSSNLTDGTKYSLLVFVARIHSKEFLVILSYSTDGYSDIPTNIL